jgi:hypothetical protein
MNRKEQKCISEKWSGRALGVLILPLALLVGAFSLFLLPVVGLLFVLPLFAFSLLLIFAPERRECRLLHG